MNPRSQASHEMGDMLEQLPADGTITSRSLKPRHFFDVEAPRIIHFQACFFCGDLRVFVEM
jgi:hypothetical protein